MKKIFIVFTILGLGMLLSGCWDNRDITEMSIATAVGVDRYADGYKVSVQVIKPSGAKGGNGSDQSGGSTGKESGVCVISETGESVFDAIRHLLKSVNKKVFFDQIQYIAFSEELSKHGIANVIDLFLRDTEFKGRVEIILTKGMSAEEFIKAKSNIESIPSRHIEGILENEKHIGKLKKTTLVELAQMLEHYGQKPVVSVIEPKDATKKENVSDLKVEKGGVFFKDKLMGYLEPHQMRGYLFTQNRIKSTIIVLENPTPAVKRASLKVKDSKGTIDVEKTEEGRFIYIANVEITANLGSQHGSENIADSSKLPTLSKMSSAIVENEIRSAYDASRKLGSDIFGFGEEIHRKYPEDWKKIRENWDNLYPENDIKINVNTEIENVGLIRSPIKIN